MKAYAIPGPQGSGNLRQSTQLVPSHPEDAPRAIGTGGRAQTAGLGAQGSEWPHTHSSLLNLQMSPLPSSTNLVLSSTIHALQNLPALFIKGRNFF